MWDDERGGVLVRSARIADLAEQAASDGWLTAAERQELERYRDGRRRTAWRCGRLLGKSLVPEGRLTIAQRFRDRPPESRHVPPGRSNRTGWEIRPALDLDLGEIEILSRDERGRAVRPNIRARGIELDCALSISHTDRLVIAAVACGARSVGIDLVPVRDVNPAALRPWFTAREVNLLRLDDLHQAARSWAIKEAAYKALNGGEPFTPRRIEITTTPAGDFAISRNGADLHGFCTVETWGIDDHVAALVTAGGSHRRAATKRAADHPLPSFSPA